jgi:hypothetical protein
MPKDLIILLNTFGAIPKESWFVVDDTASYKTNVGELHITRTRDQKYVFLFKPADKKLNPVSHTFGIEYDDFAEIAENALAHGTTAITKALLEMRQSIDHQDNQLLGSVSPNIEEPADEVVHCRACNRECDPEDTFWHNNDQYCEECHVKYVAGRQ